jgi:alginate O-acetyltransferase complex protein AlgI
MLFYDPLFLVFFLVLYALYLALIGRTAKIWTLLLGSLFFYAWGEPIFVPLLLVSALVDYILSRKIAEGIEPALAKALLAIGVASNLAILFFYKYTDFLIGNLNIPLSLAGIAPLPLLHIALPIGVSFVVFEKITYLVDTYRGVSRPPVRFSDYCVFVLFFPKLLAGPILKYHEMEGQIASPPPFAMEDFWTGFTRFARGIFKKLLIADPLGSCTDQVFGADPWSLGAGFAWLGLVCFTLQIYFDFSGYSDMAIGLARMFGFRLRENFNMPYIARSLTEFWQRWHISLTTWIRDYLYIPLGGNRVSDLKIYRNLWICFLLSGLWHGANWNFVLWGAYNGLFLTLDRMFLRRALERSGPLLATTATLFIVMIGWTIFRSPSVAHLTGYFAALAGATTNAAAIKVNPDVPATLVLGAVLSLLPATALYPPLKQLWQTARWPHLAADAGFVVLYVVALARAFAVPFQPFIYFRF